MRRSALLLLFLLGLALHAQTVSVVPDRSRLAERKRQAFELRQTDPRASEKLYRELLAAAPEDPEVLMFLGGLVSDRGRQLSAGRKRRALMREAHDYFARAEKAGSADALVVSALREINADGSENAAIFSDDAKIQKLITRAEEAFGRRDFRKAIALYQEALAIHPRHYAALVYLADALFCLEEYPEATTWFLKAIEVDPDQEMAHRYLADTFLRQGKTELALAQNIEAVIASPYTGHTWNALQRTAQGAGLHPAVPAREIPKVKVRPGEDGKVNINYASEPNLVEVTYGLARSRWQAEHPPAKGQPYRESITEELEALRTVLGVWSEMQQKADDPTVRSIATTLGPALNQLREIDEAGLLEAQIFFFRPTPDLAADYEAFRARHRAEARTFLRRFFLGVP